MNNLLKQIIQWLCVIAIAITLAVALRVFVFATFTIPTPSMEPSIISGDRVVVNKLVPGGRIITNLFSLKDGEKPNYTRVPSFMDVSRNDVLVFNFPYTDWERLDIDPSLFFTKRCVAIPRDTFFIEDGIYKVRGVSDTLGHYPNQKRFNEIPLEQIDQALYHCFPYNDRYNWTTRTFGPLYIPGEGDTLAINVENIPLYKNLIVYETQKEISEQDDMVLLGDSIINQYIFKKNYYFMTGDYVFDSKDSRYWGLLPEDHIVGKVSFVYKSVDPNTGKTRWDRFLKTIK